MFHGCHKFSKLRFPSPVVVQLDGAAIKLQARPQSKCYGQADKHFRFNRLGGNEGCFFCFFLPWGAPYAAAALLLLIIFDAFLEVVPGVALGVEDDDAFPGFAFVFPAATD